MINEIVEVSDGYARNFLINKGLAVQATAKSLEILADQKAEEARHQQLLKEGWLIDETGSIDNGYVYKDESGQHRIQSIFYPKEMTYETQDCLFLMIR